MRQGHRWTGATAASASALDQHQNVGRFQKGDDQRRWTQPRKGEAKAHGKDAFTASGQDAEVTFKLDGRSERAKISARDKGSELRKKLEGIQFTECQENATVFSGEALEEFKKTCRAKAQQAASIKGELKTLVTRLEKSVSAGHIVQEIEELNAIQDQATVVMEFLQFMKGGAGLDITQTMACIEKMQRTYKLGDTYILRICEARIQSAMVYQDAEKACGLMTSVSEEAKALAETLSPDQISAFVQNVMDNIVILTS